MNFRQFLELLSRLPARVWLQAAIGLIAFLALAVLGFALIAAVAAVVVLTILAFKAKVWLRGLFHGNGAIQPSSTWSRERSTDVTYEIVDRRDDKQP
ncbi:MAG TPA: hypothetical protein VMI56_15240 [Reyranella sp.]|nr:hypothetical protein [Reyranella sp.]